MSLLSNLIKILSGETHEAPPDLTWGWIESVEGWAGYDPAPVEPGTSYIQLYLSEMRIPTARAWIGTHYPLVYSATSFRLGNEVVEYPATAGNLDIAQVREKLDLNTAIRLNYPLTPQLPHNGGSVEIAAAMRRVSIGSGLPQLLEAVEGLGKALNVPQLSMVVGFAEPVGKVIEALTSEGDEPLLLGLHQLFKTQGEEPLRGGYFLAAKYSNFGDLSEFKVQDGQLQWAQTGVPVDDLDYMLFRLEVAGERDDYEGLASVYDPLQKARSIVEDRRNRPGWHEEVAIQLEAAAIAAWDSNDLTEADRRRLPGVLRREFDEFLVSLGLEPLGASAAPVAEAVAEAEDNAEAGDGRGPELDNAALQRALRTISPADAMRFSDHQVMSAIRGR